MVATEDSQKDEAKETRSFFLPFRCKSSSILCLREKTILRVGPWCPMCSVTHVSLSHLFWTGSFFFFFFSCWGGGETMTLVGLLIKSGRLIKIVFPPPPHHLWWPVTVLLSVFQNIREFSLFSGQLERQRWSKGTGRGSGVMNVLQGPCKGTRGGNAKSLLGWIHCRN